MPIIAPHNILLAKLAKPGLPPEKTNTTPPITMSNPAKGTDICNTIKLKMFKNNMPT